MVGISRWILPFVSHIARFSLDVSWIASRSLFKTIHRIVLPPLAGTPHFAMTGWASSNIPLTEYI
jgi:hypothetical protein